MYKRQVLRGEQSALWGSDAMGGVIYITTKKGLEKGKTFNVDYDFGTGSNRTVDGSLTLSGSNNHFYYALHGDSHHTKGISAPVSYTHLIKKNSKIIFLIFICVLNSIIPLSYNEFLYCRYLRYRTYLTECFFHIGLVLILIQEIKAATE